MCPSLVQLNVSTCFIYELKRAYDPWSASRKMKKKLKLNLEIIIDNYLWQIITCSSNIRLWLTAPARLFSFLMIEWLPTNDLPSITKKNTTNYTINVLLKLIDKLEQSYSALLLQLKIQKKTIIFYTAWVPSCNINAPFLDRYTKKKTNKNKNYWMAHSMTLIARSLIYPFACPPARPLTRLERQTNCSTKPKSALAIVKAPNGKPL